MNEVKAEVCASLADVLSATGRSDEAVTLRKSIQTGALNGKK